MGGIAICAIATAIALRLVRRGRSIVVASNRVRDGAALDVIYDTTSWTEEVRSAVENALQSSGVTPEWDGNELRVDQSYESMVDQIVAI